MFKQTQLLWWHDTPFKISMQYLILCLTICLQVTEKLIKDIIPVFKKFVLPLSWSIFSLFKLTLIFFYMIKEMVSFSGTGYGFLKITQRSKKFFLFRIEETLTYENKQIHF